MNPALPFGCLLLLASISACSGGSGEAVPQNAKPTSASTTTVPSGPPVDARIQDGPPLEEQLMLTALVTGDGGWEYLLNPKPSGHAFFTVDTTDSPPGQAKVRIARTGSTSPVTYTPFNRGMPNSPEYTVAPQVLVYRANADTRVSQLPVCHLPKEHPEDYPFGLNSLLCSTSAEITDTAAGTFSLPQAGRVVSYLNKQVPFVMFSYAKPGRTGAAGSACDLWIDPNNTRTGRSARFSTANCVKVHLDVDHI